MSEFRAQVNWTRERPDFEYDTYDRGHEVRFGGGTLIQGSAAPEFKGVTDKVNPEEMLVAALSGCHMLSFLAVAARSHVGVDTYSDEAVGYLAKNEEGKLAVTRVILRPRVKMSAGFAAERFSALHEKAHHACFIANSVKCEVKVEAQLLP